MLITPRQRQAAKESLALDGLTAFARFSELGLVSRIDAVGGLLEQPTH